MGALIVDPAAADFLRNADRAVLLRRMHVGKRPSRLEGSRTDRAARLSGISLL
jgi:hypothetical protein